MRRSTLTALFLASITVLPAAAMQQAPDAGWGGSVDGRWYAGSYAPGGWSAYRQPEPDMELPRYWVEPGFEIRDAARYRLPPAATGQRWLRYYDDAVLVGGNGRVIDARTGINWNDPARMAAAPARIFTPVTAAATAPAAPAPVIASAPRAPGATYAPPPARPIAAAPAAPPAPPAPAAPPAPVAPPPPISPPAPVEAAPSAVARSAVVQVPPPPRGRVAPPRAYPRPPASEPARSDRGVGGAAIGAGAGAVAGGLIAGRGDRLGGALIGAGVGAVAGLAIDRAEDRNRRVASREPDYPPWDDDDGPGYRDWASREVDLPPSPPPQVQVTGTDCTTRTVEVRPAYVERGWYFPATFETTVTCGG